MSNQFEFLDFFFDSIYEVGFVPYVNMVVVVTEIHVLLFVFHVYIYAVRV